MPSGRSAVEMPRAHWAARRSVEGGEKVVAAAVDLAPAKAADLPPRDLVEAVQQPPPPGIAEVHGVLGRGHDVGE
jgi:hypothetical protein